MPVNKTLTPLTPLTLFSGRLGLIGLGLGVAAGVTLIKLWPKISPALEPYIKTGIAKGLDVVDKGKELFWERSERFADVIAEIKEEQEAKTKAKAKEEPVKTQAKANSK